jgi:hypothetical protein
MKEYDDEYFYKCRMHKFILSYYLAWSNLSIGIYHFDYSNPHLSGWGYNAGMCDYQRYFDDPELYSGNPLDLFIALEEIFNQKRPAEIINSKI